jgi:hypothetical protein
MYLVLDRRAPWRYTRGLFVFLDGLKSSLRVSDIQRSCVPLPAAVVATTAILGYPVMRGVIPGLTG